MESTTIDYSDPTTDETSSSTTLNLLNIKVHHGGHVLNYSLPDDASVESLSQHIFDNLQIPPSNQKFLISPKPGLLKPPFPTTPLSTLLTSPKTKITLLGSRPDQISSLNTSIESTKRQTTRSTTGPIKPATPARRIPTVSSLHDATTYTFLSIKPLPYLPNPARSTRFLERLRDDPGIKATMAKHKWTVGLLTEMDPAAHTTHESRTLGLNRNGGEVIELRLRTDAYDGYRDYKIIRKTLCHELTHNVHSEHDRSFWDLCGQVEKEVEKGDWKHGGRRLTEEAFYEGSEPRGGQGDEVADHGSWQGKSYRIGERPAGSTSGGGAIEMDQALDRREVLAKAAEERAKRANATTRRQDDAESDDEA